MEIPVSSYRDDHQICAASSDHAAFHQRAASVGVRPAVIPEILKAAASAVTNMRRKHRAGNVEAIAVSSSECRQHQQTGKIRPITLLLIRIRRPGSPARTAQYCIITNGRRPKRSLNAYHRLHKQHPDLNGDDNQHAVIFRIVQVMRQVTGMWVSSM